jgi:phage terminase large subunit-like protein
MAPTDVRALETTADLAERRYCDNIQRREPDRLRGPQHDAAVCDELGAWSRPETWDMLLFGLRLGRHPRCLVATTPRPTKLIRELLAREGRDVVATRGSTYEKSRKSGARVFRPGHPQIRGNTPWSTRA